jgi:4-hydroxy-tetrahydrodipicolinate synthase
MAHDQGYNGGPLRQPTQRVHDGQVTAPRKGLIDAGLNPSMGPFREFFVRRERGSRPLEG